jgi:hypothetical protein
MDFSATGPPDQLKPERDEFDLTTKKKTWKIRHFRALLGRPANDVAQ